MKIFLAFRFPSSLRKAPTSLHLWLEMLRSFSKPYVQLPMKDPSVSRLAG